MLLSSAQIGNLSDSSYARSFLMPKAYAVVTYRSISNADKLAAYAKLAGPAIAPFGARFLARGNAAVAREHGLKERTNRRMPRRPPNWLDNALLCWNR